MIPRSPGHLELILVGQPRLEKFQKRIRGRLKDWKEEEHRADAELARITRHEPARINPQDPFLVRKPMRTSGLKNLSENHDEYLYGKKRKRGY